VESRNAFGYSTAYSNSVTILQAQVPDAPLNLANDPPVTDDSNIGLSWFPGAFDGASPVIDYRITYDQGVGTWIPLATGVISPSYTATSLVADTVYAFKVEARNIVGYSAESSVVSIRAAGVPEQPAAPTTTVNGDNVDIAWTAPADGGSPIIAYTVKIRETDGVTFTADVTNCDGSDSAIVSARTCSVPIATLRAAPFSLNWGDSIFAQITASNVEGDSAASTEGNGAVILTGPDNAHSLADDASVTSASRIKMTWSAGAADGGTPVIDYRITYKEISAPSF